MSLDAYYKELYEQEKKKNEKLTRELVTIEAENAEMKDKLDKLKKSRLFKLIKPFRNVYAKGVAAAVRVRRLGSVKEVVRKLKSKSIEKKACKFHGTLSFPDAERRKKESGTAFKERHVFSILVPVFNTPEKFLREMIESVTSQTYAGWELCIADGSDDEHSYVGEIIREYMDSDAGSNPAGISRIKYRKIEKNLGISGNTNVCFDLAGGDYIGLFDHDDLLHPSVLYRYMQEIEEYDPDFIYCDEVTFKGNGIDNMITLHFKPDFAIDNLRANNYICHFSVFKKELSDRCGRFRSEFDGSQDHDMILRLTAEARVIRHVPGVYYYWRSHDQSTAADINTKTYAIDAAKGAVASHLTSCGFKDFEIESTKAFATIFRIRYALTDRPKISIIIPNKDHASDLKRCTESIITKSSYDNYELIIVENSSTEDETEEVYREIEKSPFAHVVKYEAPDEEGFNFSKLVNFGVSKSSGDMILLLNNDTEVISRDWMENMLMYAQREDVGAVGSKLYYPDRTIQHAGIVIGLGAHRTAGHTHYRLSWENLGYMGRLCYAQNVSAVTGACLMVKRSDYERAGGFDESFAVALNDVDFCLKLRSLGLLNVFTPFSELYHYESVSRGDDVSGADKEKEERYNRESGHFREKWKNELEKGDPYYNINFSLDHSNYTLKASPAPMVQ
ncbi:MAG: glycosyltransferase family 2 protein [Lachnospiraceae bacterium]|nr:glycosyltransferase family 2 protein [Lachnospiraceae bacterium]